MKSKRLKSLGGTVLIMVLTVMLVLIIMLMATLTVVSTASQRIYTKYEEQQAYYTARSALDVFTGSMLGDSKFGNLNGGGVFETQGYLLQKDLYTIQTKNVDPSDSAYAAKNVDIYGSVSNPYIDYTVTLPDLNGGTGDKYGKFDDSTLNIRVEVLDRTYNCGSDGTPATGDRKKDSMQVKVTATTTFEGIEGTAAVVMKTQSPPVSAATRAVTITGGDDLTLQNTTILGGLATSGEIYMGNSGDYWGDIYLGGNIHMSGNGSRLVATDDQWIFIKDSSTIQNDFKAESHISGADESKRGNIVIGGDFKIGNNAVIGAGGNAIKMVVLGDLVTNQNNGHTHNGDLYIVGNVTQVPMQFTVNGNMYVDGNCDFSNAQNGVTITGDLIVKGTYTDVYASGPSGDSRRNVMVGGSMYPAGGVHSGNTPSVETEMQTDDNGNSVRVPKTDDQGYMEINWPGAAGPARVATYGAVYTQFYRYADPENEDTITASEYAFLTQEELDNLMKKAVDGGKAPDEEKRIHEYINENIGSAVEVSIQHSDTIASPGKYVVYPGHCGNGTLSIGGGGTVELFLMPGSYSNGGNIIVDSGTTLKVYAAPGTYNFDSQWQFITTDYVTGDPSDGKLYVGDFAPAGHDLMAMNINFYFEGACNINFNNQAIFVGHFYAPRSSVSVSQGHSIASRLVYNGVQYTPASGNPTFTFLGSMLCAKYTTSDSHGGIAFVQTAETPTPDGLPCLTFEAAEYSRF